MYRTNYIVLGDYLIFPLAKIDYNSLIPFADKSGNIVQPCGSPHHGIGFSHDLPDGLIGDVLVFQIQAEQITFVYRSYKPGSVFHRKL